MRTDVTRFAHTQDRKRLVVRDVSTRAGAQAIWPNGDGVYIDPDSVEAVAAGAPCAPPGRLMCDDPPFERLVTPVENVGPNI